MGTSPPQTASPERGLDIRTGRLSVNCLRVSERMRNLIKTSTPLPCTLEIVRSTTSHLGHDKTVNTTSDTATFVSTENRWADLHVKHDQCIEVRLYMIARAMNCIIDHQ